MRVLTALITFSRIFCTDCEKRTSREYVRPHNEAPPAADERFIVRLPHALPFNTAFQGDRRGRTDNEETVANLGVSLY